MMLCPGQTKGGIRVTDLSTVIKMMRCPGQTKGGISKILLQTGANVGFKCLREGLNAVIH